MREKILFVEDDALDRALAERALEELHYPFEILATGELALAALAKESFALVYADLRLPGMSGEELLRRSRAMAPETDVIIITAYPSLRSAIQCFRYGAYDYILKPIDVADLRLTTERCMQGRHLRQELALQTEMRQKLEELIALKTQFLANVSHEFRTPLNTILGYADLLLDDTEKLPAESHLREILERLAEGAQQLFAKVSALLDVAQLDAGALPIARAPVEVAAVLRQAAADAEGTAARQALRFASEIDTELGEVCADATRLRQIVDALLSNAFKFTPTGEVRLLARRADVEGRPWVEIEVSDTGPGVSKQLQGAIFEEFRQVDGSTTRMRTGLGLGLALCRRLVELFGGTIALESVPGVGSSFCVRLPRMERRAAQA